MTFKKIVKDKLIKNIDISVRDIEKAVEIYGEPVPTLKGNMTRATPLNHDILENIDLPENKKGK